MIGTPQFNHILKLIRENRSTELSRDLKRSFSFFPESEKKWLQKFGIGEVFFKTGERAHEIIPMLFMCGAVIEDSIIKDNLVKILKHPKHKRILTQVCAKDKDVFNRIKYRGGKTPLHLAADLGRVRAVNLSLKLGLDAKAKCKITRHTVLSVALERLWENMSGTNGVRSKENFKNYLSIVMTLLPLANQKRVLFLGRTRKIEEVFLEMGLFEMV